MNEQTDILLGRAAGRVWIRVNSHGNFQNSPPLKMAAENLISHGETQFVVDLGGCTGMDSTFMGTLSGIALKLRRRNGALQVVNAGERNRDSLVNLGLDAVMDIHERGSTNADDAQPPAEPLPGESATTREDKTRTMLDAHRALIEAQPANRDQFEDVVEYLRRETEGKPGAQS